VLELDPEELVDGLVGHKAFPVTGTTGVVVPPLGLIGVEVPDIALVLRGVVVPRPVLGDKGVDVPNPVLGIPEAVASPGCCVLEAQAESTKASTASAENTIVFFILVPPFLN